jgi:uracil-DNA glycosylase family 4
VTASADKLAAYQALVEERKACRICGEELTNPSACEGGAYDSGHIGPWTLWQGKLDSELMVVGQDWGDQEYFVKYRGRDLADNPTNQTLHELLTSIGLDIEKPTPQDSGGGKIFLTNAVLCLKREGGMQGKTKSSWFKNCGLEFLRRTIDIVRPRVIVTLGERAYRAVADLYAIERQTFRSAVECEEGFELEVGIRLFPVYHCGARILNTHRKKDVQEKDWAKIKRALRLVPLVNAGRDEDPAPPSAMM